MTSKRSKIGDLGLVHVGTWYASRHCDLGVVFLKVAILEGCSKKGLSSGRG